ATRTPRPTRSPTCRACRRRSRGAPTTSRPGADSRRRSNGGSTAGRRSRRSAERPVEEVVDRLLAVGPDGAGAGAGEMRLSDQLRVLRAALLPVYTRPREPRVLLLIEHVERLVAELGELRAPSGSA